MQLFQFLFALQHMKKKPALQSKRVGVLQMAFLTQKLFGTFEKRAPGLNLTVKLNFGNSSFVIEKKMKTTRKNEKKKKKFEIPPTCPPENRHIPWHRI